MACIHLPDSGSLCHEPGSTIPSWAPTSQPANSQNHPRNCRDLLEPAVASVAHKCGGSCSTTAVWVGPKQSTGRQRNCMDRQGLRGRAVLWAAAAEAIRSAVSAAAWAVAWAAALAVAWEMAWAGRSAWSLAKLWSRSPGQPSYSSSPSAPGTTYSRSSVHSPFHCPCPYCPGLPHNRTATKWTCQTRARATEAGAAGD